MQTNQKYYFFILSGRASSFIWLQKAKKNQNIYSLFFPRYKRGGNMGILLQLI